MVGKSTSKQHLIIIDDELGVMDIFRDKEGKRSKRTSGVDINSLIFDGNISRDGHRYHSTLTGIYHWQKVSSNTHILPIKYNC